MRSPNVSISRWLVAGVFMAGLMMLPGVRSAWADNGHDHADMHHFDGRYVTAYHGFDASITGTTSEPNPPAIPYSVSGAMESDGKGNVKGFENVDYGSPGIGSAATCVFTGTYSVASASNGVSGMVTLNLSPSCATVTCTGSTVPSCSPGNFSASSPTQWFCALSGAAGKKLVCTEMGEAASNTTFQTPISAVSWSKSNGSGGGGD